MPLPLLLTWVLLTLPACTELDQSLKALGLPQATGGVLDEAKIAAGLK